MRFINFSKEMSGVQASLKHQLNRFFALFGNYPRWLRIDGGREFGESMMDQYCADCAIELTKSTPYNQYENGISERGIRTIAMVARCFAIQMEIPI